MSIRSSRTRRDRRRALAAAAAAVGVALSLTAAAPASAAQPQAGHSGADAGGLVPILFGGPVIFPPAEARNPGAIHPYVQAGDGQLSPGDLPNFPGDFGLGVLGQRAIAYPSTPLPGNVLPQSQFGNDLVSAACAGLVDANGSLELGDTGECGVNTGQANGVSLNLGTIGLRAGAVSASCTVDQEGYWESAMTAADARIVTPGIPPLIPDITLFAIPLSPSRNFGPNIGVAELTLHKVTMIGERDPLTGALTALGNAVDGRIPAFGAPLPAGAAGVEVSALELEVLGTGIKAGNVVCYREIAAADPDIPLIPAEGVPAASGAMLAVAGAALVLHRRRATGLIG